MNCKVSYYCAYTLQNSRRVTNHWIGYSQRKWWIYKTQIRPPQVRDAAQASPKEGFNTLQTGAVAQGLQNCYLNTMK